MAEIDAYSEALKSGQYEKPGGLLGKYDNVRRFWEDEQLGLYLRPYLENLVSRRQKEGKRLRIFDVGCGSGDGFELIASINHNQAPLSEHNTRIITPERLEFYRGVDINEGLLEQARSIYGGHDNMSFVHADFNEFDFGAEEPYDLYLANYGGLSHNTDEQTIEMLSNIAKNGKDGAIIIIDWLGRYAYEWQTLWTRDLSQNQWMDYVISYIYSDSEEKPQELSSFPLRIMGRQEAQRIHQQAKKKADGSLALRKLADRSSLVGRHIDTAQYNPHAQPLRRMVNSLFEFNLATNLDELLVKYVPASGFDEVNAYYQRFVDWWNYLVLYTKAGLEKRMPPAITGETPVVARRTLSTMTKILKTASRTGIGNPRASLVEPQLGYCLRELEMGLQKGLGCGHGLVAIFEIVK